MSAVAEETLPVTRALDGLWWPAFWDSEPFARHLARAADLYVDAPAAHRALADISGHIEDVVSARGTGFDLMQIGFTGKEKSGVQAIAFAALVPALHPTSVHAVCCTRLRALLPGLAASIDIDRVGAVLQECKRCKPHIAMCLIKTMCNAWCTSHRLHEACRLPCVFGCKSGLDKLSHYLECPNLWGLVSLVLGGEWFPTDILGRLGLSTPSLRAVHGVFMAFHVYHAVKVSHREVVVAALDSSDFSPTYLVARSSARAALALIRPGP